MLYLQRASAGSGKTYALTRRYIEMLITVRTENGAFRLRRDAELADSMRHILAVTFTNKATNEMKSRIVSRLSALANPEDTEADYLDYFTRSPHHFDPSEVRKTCRRALALMLHDYSGFQVSTIDSFFQTVLRTFAYETDLNDSYSVELDTALLSNVGIDETLAQANRSDADTEIAYWISHFMERGMREGHNGNLFQKSRASNSAYLAVSEVAARMQKEEYKAVRADLDRYFEKHPDYRLLFEAMQGKYEEPARAAAARAKEEARRVQAYMENCPIPKDYFNSNFWGHIKKIISSPWDALNTFAVPDLEKRKIILVPKQRLLSAEVMEEVMATVRPMYAAYIDWERELQSKTLKLWNLYRRNMVYLGIMQAIRHNTNRYLEENNAIELSETNLILRSVIGDDDTPFIYERLGSRLNHFLIDEFQDTSRMQYDNLRPLLTESMGRGNDNLIIGDAKQSIYRFRNADSTLITDVVPNEEVFPQITMLGDSPEDNTNHRSDRRIVEFNNSLFRAMAQQLDEENEETTNKLSRVYSNTVQPLPEKRAALTDGYIEVRFVHKPDDNNGPLKHLPQLGPLISELCRRGYRQRDIGVLFRRKTDSEQFINYLVAYNESLPEGERRIEFISEESLKVARSAAVGIVISAMEMIVAGTEHEMPTGQTREKRGVGTIAELRCNFHYFCLHHPELQTMSERLNAFIENPSTSDDLRALLSSMQSVALPALVEGLTDAFVDDKLRREDAAFLAAFQDLVLDYCENYCADIASFLDYWEAKKESATISAPETSEAINIMTIHKAKGLQFKCVILGWVSGGYLPSRLREEWRWVVPCLEAPEGMELPPYVAVSTSSQLKDTPHEGVFADFCDKLKADFINTWYVAFTRPENELYVFTGAESKSGIGKLLHELPATFNTLKQNASPEDAQWMLDEENISFEKTAPEVMEEAPVGTIPLETMTIGTKKTPKYKSDKDEMPSKPLDSYRVHSSLPLLLYKEGDLDADEDDDNTDPRRQGTIMHEIMAHIRTLDDIPRAVLRAKVKGLLSAREAKHAEKILLKRLSEPAVREWFDGSMKVITERKLSGLDTTDTVARFRPDRIMLSPDGDLTVVDYKFGLKRRDEAYSEQVGDYLRILSEALPAKPRSARGYIFYVNLGIVQPVENNLFTNV